MASDTSGEARTRDGASLHDKAARHDTSGAERARLNQQIAMRNRWTAITAIGGAALAAAGLGLLLWHW